MAVMDHPEAGELSSTDAADAGFMADRMPLQQVCDRWGCDARTVRRAVLAGKLAEGRRVFGRTWFRIADVIEAERRMLGE